MFCLKSFFVTELRLNDPERNGEEHFARYWYIDWVRVRRRFEYLEKNVRGGFLQSFAQSKFPNIESNLTSSMGGQRK